MTRREFMVGSTAMLGATAIASPAALAKDNANRREQAAAKPLRLPRGPISVAFLVSEGFQMIDFAGPWEIFQDVTDPKSGKPSFELFTVSRTGTPLKASGGLKVTPDHAFADAPVPNVLVIPAQTDKSADVLAWIRKVAAHADVTMSVCTGAFLLAEAGLLDGLPATTHHGAYNILAVEHPHVKVVEKVRFVDTGRVATASGLSAGIDLALHIVARYFGAAIADQTATYVEYAGYGWKNPHDTGDLFSRIDKEHKGLECPVCHMGPIGKDVSTLYEGKTYYFC